MNPVMSRERGLTAFCIVGYSQTVSQIQNESPRSVCNSAFLVSLIRGVALFVPLGGFQYNAGQPMRFHIAQLNVGRLLHPLDHAQIAEFVNGLSGSESSIERIILYPVKAAIHQKKVIAIHQAKLHACCVLAQLTIKDDATGALPPDG
jgi:hypothetical protein